jgi:exoribonuclease-2
MLPECLSEDKLSLKEGEARPTLSCIIELNAQLSVLRTEIRPSLIKSRKRYTYDEFEALLEDAHSEHHKLYELTSILEENRIENGAQKVYKRDLLIDLADDGTLSLREIDEHGPARALVGELMIFANALLAQYAVTHRIPVVFRCQEPPEPLPEQTPRGDDINGQPSNAATGPAADYAERSKMKKSSTSVTPARHSGLGLDAYIQATSPIRRYIDLVNQRQILHHLRHGTPRYQRSEVEEIIFAAEQPLATANTINKETRRFWLLTYLVERMERARAAGRREEGMVISATVLRTDLRNPLVELDEIFMPTLVKFQRTPQVGDQVSLRIASIDPQRDYLRLEPLQDLS